MLRSLSGILAGYLSLQFISYFPRLVLTIYMRSPINDPADISLYKITPIHYGLLGIDLFAGFFAAMIAMTIIKKSKIIFLLVLLAIIVSEGIISVFPIQSSFLSFEMISYIFKVSGIILGGLIYKRTNKNN